MSILLELKPSVECAPSKNKRNAEEIGVHVLWSDFVISCLLFDVLRMSCNYIHSFSGNANVMKSRRRD